MEPSAVTTRENVCGPTVRTIRAQPAHRRVQVTLQGGGRTGNRNASAVLSAACSQAVKWLSLIKLR
jgi:hypothetical protein